MTLRRLLALKARLWWRGFPPGHRATVLIIGTLVVGLCAPAWIGSAALVFTLVARLGAPALVLVFAAAQLLWLAMVMIANAWGTAFDMQRMLRFPVHPRVVHLSGLAFGLLSLPALVTLPALAAATLAAGRRGGAGAAVATALAVALLVTITLAVRELLIVLLQAFGRIRWLRYLQEALAVVLTAGGYLVYLSVRDRMEAALHATQTTPSLVLGLAGAVNRFAPTAAWPAQLAAGALEGRWIPALAGAAGALALIAVLVESGWRIAYRVALGRETAPPRGPQRAPSAPARAPGPPGPHGAPRPPLALLLEREVTLVLREPQLLGFTAYAVLLTLVFRGFVTELHHHLGPVLVVMLSLQMQSLTLSLFGTERESLRLLFLLPLSGRVLLMAKDLGVVLQLGFTVLAALVTLGVTGYPVFGLPGAEFVLWALAMAAACLMVGNHISALHPVRLNRRRRAASAAGLMPSLVHAFVLMGTCGALIFARWLATTKAPAGRQDVAALLSAVALAAPLALAWWARLGSAGRLVDTHREHMLAEIATPTEAG